MKATGLTLLTGVDGSTELRVVLDKSSTETARKLYDTLHEQVIDVEIKKYRPKRSTEANDYFWVLCGKLAVKLGISKTEAYHELIRDVGGNFYILCLMNDAVGSFVEDWGKKGLGYICDVSESKLPGCKTVHAYIGSHDYDTAQMTALINLTTQACLDNGIETRPDEEVISMLKGWCS